MSPNRPEPTATPRAPSATAPEAPAASADQRVAKGRATRDRLIEAARELFGERGYDRTSIEAILEHAGVARGALYHHFATKEAVFDAVLDRTIAEITETVAAAARDAADPVDGLRAGCGAWLDVALDPALQRIIILDAPVVVGWARLREIDEQHTLGGVKATLAQIAQGGGVPADQIDVLAHMVLAAVDEAALLIARADDKEAAHAAGRAAIDTLLSRLVRAG